MSDLSRVKLWAQLMPLSPIDLCRMSDMRLDVADAYVTRHRRCYELRRTIVESRIVAGPGFTDCRLADEHFTPADPSPASSPRSYEETQP